MTAARAQTVFDLVRAAATARGGAPAVLGTDGQEPLTYAELLHSVESLADALAHAGVARDGVVLVSLPNGPQMLTAVLGTMCAATCAPMNPAYTTAELEVLAHDVGATAVVTRAGGESAAAALARMWGLPCLRVAHPGPTAGILGLERDEISGSSGEPASSDHALLLHTSGTTARPKQVPLSHGNLAAAAANVVGSLDLTSRDRCLNVMPLFHSHGLLGAALSSVAAGASIVCAEVMDPRHFLRWATETGATWYTAAPTIHQLVLEAPGDWAGFRFMRSASAPLAPQIAEALERRYGAPMIEVFGMTEAYQIAANPLPPGERRLGSVGVPTGTEIAVLNTDGQVVAAGVEGEVVVRGPAVFSGYSSPPGANDDAFVDGWFRTGDLGRLSEDGYLTITGRLKEQINRGGEKVAPREIDEALLAHPDIAEAMAFSVPDPLLGEEVVAAVVPRPGAHIDLPSVRGFLAERLAPFKVPRRLVVVDHLPKSSTGKLQRVGFAEEYPNLVAPRPRPHAPTTDEGSVEHRLGRIWQDLLGIDEPISPEARFFDLGGTSLGAMELVVTIEERFGVDLPVIDVAEVPALAELAARIEARAAGESPSSLLRPYRVRDASSVAVLVPGAWGMAVGLNLIGEALEERFDVYLFDYPGHRAGEMPCTTIDGLAARLIEALGDLAAGDELVLYGNSMGSWVVLEAGRRLHEAGSPPSLVALGDMYNPDIASVDPSVAPSFRTRLKNRLRRLRRALTTRKGLVGPRNPSSAKARQQSVYAASERAQRAYRNPGSYPGDVLLLVTEERAGRLGPDLGWGPMVAGQLEIRQVPGGHSALHRDQGSRIAGFINELSLLRSEAEPS